MSNETATLADDCEVILRLLADAGPAGLSLIQLETATGWSAHRANTTLCALTISKRRQVETFKERGPRGRKTVYRVIIK